jgi:cytochrome c2
MSANGFRGKRVAVRRVGMTMTAFIGMRGNTAGSVAKRLRTRGLHALMAHGKSDTSPRPARRPFAGPTDEAEISQGALSPMDAFEWNKIAGAVLGTLLIIFGLSIFSEILFETEVPESPGYVIAVAEEPGAEGEAGGEAAAQPIGILMASADAAAGEASAKKCGACHTFAEGEPHKIGPNLWDVVNRPIAGAPGYEYSPDMQAHAQQAQTWTFEHLNTFLQNPKGVVPGTKMAFAGLKNDAERANVIAYLRSLSANPAPLPAPEAEAAEAAPAEGGAAAQAAAAPAEGQQQSATEQGAAQSSEGAQAAEDTGESGGADPAAQPQGSLGAIDSVPADQQGAVPQVPAVDQPAPGPQAAAQGTEPTSSAAGQPTGEPAAAPAEPSPPRPEPPPASNTEAAGQAQQSTAGGTQPAPTPPPAQAPAAEQQTAQAQQPAAEAQPTAQGQQTAQAEQAPAATEAAAGDPTAGAAFARRCAACHTMEQGGGNKVGPTLWAVVDRPIASVPDYAYSDAMVAFSEGGAKRWDIDTLHAYLANPKEVVPGTKMVFPGIRNPADLANVSAYLRTLSETPPQ